MQANDHDLLQQSILGSLLTWPGEIDKISSVLSLNDFTKESYRDVYQYLLKNDGGDLVTVSTALKGKVRPEDLCTWIGHEVTSAFLPRYCQQLKEISRKVQIVDTARHIGLMFEESTSTEMLEKLESLTTSITGKSSREPIEAMALVIDSARRLKSRYENRGKIQGVPFGYDALDAVTCGMQRGDLIIIAGRPSMGKSAFAGNVLENICEAGFSGMLFSLEMKAGNVTDRMVSSRGGIQYGNIRSGNLTDVEWTRNSQCSEKISKYRLAIDDTPGITLREIRSKVRKRKRLLGLDVVVVDYLQLMGINPRDNRVQAIGEITRGLKQLALECDVTVVLLSQLSRALESRPNKRPLLSDLRDSGEIEQDADVILFPYREAVYCEKCKQRVNDGTHRLYEHLATAELIIGKQRNGEANLTLPMVWMGHFQRFEAVTA